MTTYLPRIFGKGIGAFMTVQPEGIEQELPQGELYKMLWAYYLNNGLYDQLRLWGLYSGNTWLSEVRNPAKRTVEFYPAVIWPGEISQGLPLVVDSKNTNVEPAIKQLWRWSNWAANRQVSVRWAAVMGDVYLKIAQPPGGQKRVYIQLLEPAHVTAKTADERGYLTYCRIDVPRVKDGRRATYTEAWDKTAVRIWEHQLEAGASLARLGTPNQEIKLSTWGIDFVPIVHIRHINIGGDYGLGAYTAEMSKIDETNMIATRLHKMLYRHNDVTWALKANAMDANNRPLPPPTLKDASGQVVDTIELGGERIHRLPGNSSLESLVPQLDYASALAILQDQMAELERDLPETMFFRTKDLPELSGKALRLLLAPAVAKAHEVRGNHEDGLIRAQEMALTIGAAIGAWQEAGIGDVGRFERGDFAHHFAERPIIATGRDEIAELTAAEVGAGIPLTNSLRRSGWTEEELEQLREDKEAEQEMTQQSLATAVLNAQGAMNGQSSNGMEQPMFGGFNG